MANACESVFRIKWLASAVTAALISWLKFTMARPHIFGMLHTVDAVGTGANWLLHDLYYIVRSVSDQTVKFLNLPDAIARGVLAFQLHMSLLLHKDGVIVVVLAETRCIIFTLANDMAMLSPSPGAWIW